MEIFSSDKWSSIVKLGGRHVWNCVSENDSHFAYAALLSNPQNNDEVLTCIDDAKKTDSRVKVNHLFLVRTFLDQPTSLTLTGSEQQKQGKFECPPDEKWKFVGNAKIAHGDVNLGSGAATICAYRIEMDRDSVFAANKIHIRGTYRIRLIEGIGIGNFTTIDQGSYEVVLDKSENITHSKTDPNNSKKTMDN